MTRKKLVIYGVTFISFMALFMLYVWSMVLSTTNMNQSRLKESITIFESQIYKNLEYQVKDLLFVVNELGLKRMNSIEDLTGVIGKDYYIVDDEGVLYSRAGHLNGRKIQTAALKVADTEGYGIIPMTDTEEDGQKIAMVVPVSDKGQFYLVQLADMTWFLTRISENLSLSGSGIVLFDEWGNQQGYCGNNQIEITQESIESLVHGVGLDNYRGYETSYKKLNWTQVYNVYIPLGQPTHWFIGFQADYSDGNIITSVLPSSSIIIFILLFFILIVVIGLDVFNDREKRRELKIAGNIDALTGLISGTGMQEAVSAYMRKSTVDGMSFISLDVVAFGRINSMFGYSLGDSLLKAVAEVIKENYDCGVRVNADCFTFFAVSSDKMIEKIEQKLRDGIRKQLGDQYLQMIAFRYGIYPLTEKKLSFREVYDGSLLALKEVKKQYKNNSAVYNEQLEGTKELQKSIEINMLHALSRDEFHVYIQPQFDLNGQCCNRAETLIRWQSEFMGFLPPDKFIPVFENNGFIVETDFFMLSSALELLQERISQGKPPITLAVNQSKVTISFPNYYERLKKLVESYNVPRCYIELEITESTLENDWEIIVPLIHNIKKLGFNIAMDDFGSGFSSLNTLRILPIDILKIDKGFLKESNTSERSKKIIRSIINMAKDLEIQIVCEGVETEEQLEFLKAARCDIIQGYYYSKPLPMEEFIEQYMPD